MADVPATFVTEDAGKGDGSGVSWTALYSLLWRARRRQIANRLRQTLAEGRLMLLVIAGFILTYWIFFTWLFYRGMEFMEFSVPALGGLLLSRMFYLLFALILGMLIISSAITSYGVFFRNAETAWLQTLPVSHARLFRWKFLEMAVLASWAFVFLSGPVFLAYGIVLKLSPEFLPGVALLFLPFCLLANAVGAAAILFLVQQWHRRWGQRIILAGFLLAIGGALWCFKPVDVNALRDAEIVPLMNSMLKNTRVLAEPVLPSYWLASGVIGLGERLWGKSLFFFGLTASYALLTGWLLLRFAGGLFYENCSAVQDHRLHGRTSAKRGFQSPVARIGALLLYGLPWLRRPARAILLKDWITFWRDTGQWSQFAIFFGLLGFYFLNVRNLRYQLDDRFWVSVVAFLNLSSLALILSTLTTRFVFPQFSLEGQRLWIVGLAPLSMKEVIWGKFWFSAMANGAITTGLMFFSFTSLRLESEMRWIIAFTVVMLSLGLSGLAVGMGVLFPNLKSGNAAQIVSGFGGTFCLVLSLAYVALAVLLVALPMHLRYMARLPLEFRFTSPVGLIYTLTLLLSATAAFVPMRLAEKKLDRIEL